MNLTFQPAKLGIYCFKQPQFLPARSVTELQLLRGLVGAPSKGHPSISKQGTGQTQGVYSSWLQMQP